MTVEREPAITAGAMWRDRAVPGREVIVGCVLPDLICVDAPARDGRAQIPEAWFTRAAFLARFEPVGS